MANLAQIVNVLQAPVMTSGRRIWLTPTYHALRLHAPHIGATALPIEIEHSSRLPNGGSAVTATASHTADGLALTVINRRFDQGASVRVACADAPEQANGQMLTADSPAAGNSAEQPDRIAPNHLPVANDGHDAWRIELPPHTLATVLFRATH